jgi:sugar lactone lactonase YvrE
MTQSLFLSGRLSAVALTVCLIACQRQIVSKTDLSAPDGVARQVTSASLHPGIFDKYTYLVDSVHTLAGSTFPGFLDGKGIARFDAPLALALDVAGNIYIADKFNNRIRKMTPDGTVSTVAGVSFGGYKDGPAAAAQFQSPTGVAVDGRGYIYVADQGNNRIRVISTDGMVSTLAGTGVAGFSDGAGNVAKFKYPAGVAVDAAGVVYVADAGNNRIRRISIAGVVTQWVGDGNAGFKDAAGALAELNNPTGVAVGPAGVVYVVDAGNNSIRKIVSGVISTLAGNGVAGDADGMGTAAAFNSPYGLAVDGAGNILVTDVNNGRVREITPAGLVKTLFGKGVLAIADGYEPVGRMYSPTGIAIDANGDVLLTDDNLIRKMVAGTGIGTFAGGIMGNQDGVGINARFALLSDVKFDGTGNMYVSDYYNQNIRKVTPAGASTVLAGDDIWRYGASSNSNANSFRDGMKAAAQTGVQVPGIDGTGTAAKFSYPTGITIDPGGNIYVCEQSGGRIRKITPQGVTSTIAGSGERIHRDGPGLAAGFQFLQNVTMDAAGNLYATDENYIRKIDVNGVVSTLFTLPKDAYGFNRSAKAIIMGGDGNLYISSQYVSSPFQGRYIYAGDIWKVTLTGNGSVFAVLPIAQRAYGLAYDATRHIIYATVYQQDGGPDHSVYGSYIVQFDATGQISYLAGGSVGSVDGQIPVARLGFCQGLALGSDGALYITEDNQAVSRIRIMGLPK